MPELPEVETVAQQLDSCVAGAELVSARIFDPKLKKCKLNKLRGRTIAKAKRVGKQVVFSSDPADLHLCVHLRMSGNLLWCSAEGGGLAERERELFSYFKRKHLRARLDFDRGTLFFIDPRRFGTLALVDSLDELEAKGVDPLSKTFTAKKLSELLARTKQPIKSWLIRQDKLVGLGNIYASEILFRSGVLPDRMTNTLEKEEIAAIHKAIKHILRAAIKHNGTSFSDFRGVTAEYGAFQDFLKVYGREDEPCRTCKTPIERFVQQQRSTFYCPSCQR